MKSVDNVEELIRRANAVPRAETDRRTLNDIFEAQEESKRAASATFEPNIWRMILRSKAGYLAASILIISSWVTCFVLSRKVTDVRSELEMARRKIRLTPADDSATINLYFREHQDVAARVVRTSLSAPPPARMRVDRHDILYYEFLDDPYEFRRPGIIIRGPSSRDSAIAPEAPAISNGHTLTLSEAREAVDFDLVSPSWLHPGYSLDQIRRIEGRDALQLLYTDGINSVSLFEQPLDGQRGLSPQDFREYAVYLNQGQARGTILAWRDDILSYVLIGNSEMSQLMSMAQSISAGK